MDFEKIVKNIEKRNMSAYFAKDKEEAVKTAFEIMESYRAQREKSDITVAWGGSVTLDEAGIKEAVAKEGYSVFNPYSYPPSEQARAKKMALLADVFLTSSNAITEDGELVNIDGNGNRVAAMIYGPDRVIYIIGKNKITDTVENAYKRIKEVTCPKNAARLGRKTPCSNCGECTPCLIPGQTMCSHTVITRFSSVTGRAHVILVDETLGY